MQPWPISLLSNTFFDEYVHLNWNNITRTLKSKKEQLANGNTVGTLCAYVSISMSCCSFLVCVRVSPFSHLLFELIGSMLEKVAHAQHAGEALADTHQSGRQPDSPPLCRTTSQDRPLTTTMLIEVLIRRPGPKWQIVDGQEQAEGARAGSPRVTGTPSPLF